MRKRKKLQRKGLGVNKETEIKSLVEKAKVYKEDKYVLWMYLQPLWQKWAYQMGQVDYEKADWIQESYMVFEEAVKAFREGYGITFTAYYRMILYRKGKKYFIKPRDYLLFKSEDEKEQNVQRDESIAIEEEVLQKEEASEVKEKINKVLKTLKEKDRELIIEVYFKERGLKETAQVLGMSYDALECKKRRLLKKLRNTLLKK